MNVMDLADRLLRPEEHAELQESLALLQRGEAAAFYAKNREIVGEILFLESEAEFLDFSSSDRLDGECFCAAFLCAEGYGLQAGGYEEDLTKPLTTFFERKGLPELREVIERETVYTDCSDLDNFRESMEEINRALAPRGLRAVVLEDCLYCDCEYTLLLLESPLAEELAAGWQSESLELYIS